MWYKSYWFWENFELFNHVQEKWTKYVSINTSIAISFCNFRPTCNKWIKHVWGIDLKPICQSVANLGWCAMDEDGQCADKVIQVLTSLISLSCDLIYFIGMGKS